MGVFDHLLKCLSNNPKLHSDAIVGYHFEANELSCTMKPLKAKIGVLKVEKIGHISVKIWHFSSFSRFFAFSKPIFGFVPVLAVTLVTLT